MRLAEDAAWLTLLLYAYQQGGVGEVGWVAVVLLVPAVVLAPAVAVLPDWMSPSRVLPLGFGLLALFLAATALSMITEAPSWVVYVFATVFSVGLTFPAPAVASLIPRLTTTPDQLTAGNVGIGMVTSIGELAGPAMAGVLLVSFSPGVALAGMAAVMGVSALASRSTVPRGTSGDEHPDDPPIAAIRSRLLAGVRLLRKDRQARLIVFVLGTTLVAAGALDVGAAAIAVEKLGRREASASILITSIGAGTLLGVVLSIGLVGRQRLSFAIVSSAIVSAAAFAALSQVETVIPAIALLVVVGAGASVTAVAGRTMLQSLAPDDTLARVFGVLESTTTGALAIGGATFSACAAAFGLDTALLVLGIVGAVVPAVLWPALRMIDDRRQPIDLELLQLVRSTVIFAPLPPFALEQLLQNLVRDEFEPGEIMLRHGEPGDDMMVIGRGQAVVQIPSGETIVRNAGSYVGELALLTNEPRNADVAAGPDGATVFRLRGEVFLDAVNQVPRSRARVEAEAARRAVTDQPNENPGHR